LIPRLVEADTDHDVGCHTFSHVVFSDPRITREVVAAELDAAIEAGRRHGVEYDSFVFPRNAVGYRELLADRGFTTYRGARSLPPSGVRRSLGKLAAAVDPDRVELVAPTVDEYGLVDIRPSLFLFGFEGTLRTAVETMADVARNTTGR
jgi:peptidoglycan/xylan/chitin deacetylase (PgdA/CDA1 family)